MINVFSFLSFTPIAAGAAVVSLLIAGPRDSFSFAFLLEQMQCYYLLNTTISVRLLAGPAVIPWY